MRPPELKTSSSIVPGQPLNTQTALSVSNVLRKDPAAKIEAEFKESQRAKPQTVLLQYAAASKELCACVGNDTFSLACGPERFSLTQNGAAALDELTERQESRVQSDATPRSSEQALKDIAMIARGTLAEIDRTRNQDTPATPNSAPTLEAPPQKEPLILGILLNKR